MIKRTALFLSVIFLVVSPVAANIHVTCDPAEGSFLYAGTNVSCTVTSEDGFHPSGFINQWTDSGFDFISGGGDTHSVVYQSSGSVNGSIWIRAQFGDSYCDPVCTYEQGSDYAYFTGSTLYLPVIPVSNFTASPTAGTAPLFVSFTDTSTGSPTSWAWNFSSVSGGEGVSNDQNPSHTYEYPGTYNVSLTATNSEGSSTAYKNILVNTTSTEPGISFEYVPHEGVPPLTVQFNDTSTIDRLGWDWKFGDNVSFFGYSHGGDIYTCSEEDAYGHVTQISSCTRDILMNPVHTYTGPGEFTVSMTLWDPTLWLGSASGTVRVILNSTNQTPINPDAYINLYALNDAGSYFDGPHFWIANASGNSIALPGTWSPAYQRILYGNPRRVGDLDLQAAIPSGFSLIEGAGYTASATANSTGPAYDVGTQSFTYTGPGQDVFITLHYLENVTPTVIPTNPVAPTTYPTTPPWYPWWETPTPTTTITAIITSTYVPDTTPTGNVTTARTYATYSTVNRVNTNQESLDLWTSSLPGISALLAVGVIAALVMTRKNGGK